MSSRTAAVHRRPSGDLVVDSLDSETKDNQIAGRITGPRIWLSRVSISTEDNQIGTAGGVGNYGDAR
jgi:hypothetical protein